MVRFVIAGFVFLVATCGFLFGAFDRWLPGPDFDCDPTDRSCLIAAAFDLERREFRNRDIDMNYEPYARRMADLLLLTPKSERATLRNSLSRRGEWARALDTNITRRLHRIEGDDTVTLQELDRVLKYEQSPPNGDIADFAEDSFEHLLKRPDPQPAIELYFKHFRLLWQLSPRTIFEVHEWMVQNDLAALTHYQSQYITPHGHYYNGTAKMAQAAAGACRAGDVEKGQQLVAMIRTDFQYWKDDRPNQARHMAGLVEGVLYCEGITAATALFDQVMVQAELNFEAEGRKGLSESDLKYSIDHIKSRIAPIASAPLTHWYWMNGDEAAAKAMNARLPQVSFTMDLGATGLTNPSHLENSWADFKRHNLSLDWYSGAPNVQLNWYMTHYDPRVTDDWDHLEEVAAVLDTAWSREIGERVIARTLDHLDARVAEAPRYSAFRDKIALQLAGLEKKHFGCQLEDWTLPQLLDRTQAYKSKAWITESIIAVVKYGDLALGAANPGACTATDWLDSQ